MSWSTKHTEHPFENALSGLFFHVLLDACGHCWENSGWLVLGEKHVGTWLWLEEVQGADRSGCSTNTATVTHPFEGCLPCSRLRPWFPRMGVYFLWTIIRAGSIVSEMSSVLISRLQGERYFQEQLAEWMVQSGWLLVFEVKKKMWLELWERWLKLALC